LVKQEAKSPKKVVADLKVRSPKKVADLKHHQMDGEKSDARRYDSEKISVGKKTYAPGTSLLLKDQELQDQW